MPNFQSISQVWSWFWELSIWPQVWNWDHKRIKRVIITIIWSNKSFTVSWLEHMSSNDGDRRPISIIFMHGVAVFFNWGPIIDPLEVTEQFFGPQHWHPLSGRELDSRWVASSGGYSPCSRLSQDSRTSCHIWYLQVFRIQPWRLRFLSQTFQKTLILQFWKNHKIYK